MTTGGGATHLNESLAVMNIPNVNTMLFSLIEAGKKEAGNKQETKGGWQWNMVISICEFLLLQ